MFWMNFAEPRSASSMPTPKPKGPAAAAKKAGPPGAAGAAGPNAEVVDEEEEEGGEAVSAVVSDLVPWGVSILVHAALVLIAILWVWATIQAKVEEEAPIIPIARLSEKPGAPLTMKSTTQPTKASAQKRSVTKSEKTAEKIASKVKADTSLIGVAGGAESKGSPFGNANVGTGGPFKAGFYGSGGNAKRLAYIIDASGSLIDTLPFVIDELKRSINELSEQQSFTVIFFGISEGKVAEVPPPGLKPVTSETRTNAFKWFDLEEGNVSPGGQAGTAPVEAIKRALSYKPDLMFLLSDNITGQGRYELTQSQLTTEIKSANKNKTKINTIQFLYPDPLLNVKGMKPTLQVIADQSGGLFKFVRGEDLGISE